MRLIELNDKDFEKFSNKHKLNSFHQSIEWANLKNTNGWKKHLVGLDDDGKIIAGALLLSKNTPIKKRMFYSPRGFLIDYSNAKLLNFFTKEIKIYIKKNNGIFLKIDPYIEYQKRDLDGNIIENTKNNKIIDNLKKNGFQHFGFNLMQDTLQPRWLFTTNTKNRTLDEIMKEMDPKTRQILHKNERMNIKIREIGYDEIPLFKDIMAHTGDRRQFIDRPLKYYQDMYKNLKDIIKILIAEINTKELIKNITKEINDTKKELDDRVYKHDNNILKMNENKYINKNKENENNIDRLNKKLLEIQELNKKHGDIIVLGGILFLINEKEVVSLVGGSYKEFIDFQSAYTLHFTGLKYALEHNLDRYNFYGITGDFSNKNPLLGLYLFKKSFGGQVVELIGEFDLVINKPLYYLYKVAFKLYRFIKNLKN